MVACAMKMRIFKHGKKWVIHRQTLRNIWCDSFQEVLFRIPDLLRDEFLRKCWDADSSWPVRAAFLRVSPGFENWKTYNEHRVAAGR
jgi:hypothetical protein